MNNKKTSNEEGKVKKETLLNILFVAAIAVAITMYFVRDHISWALLPVVPLLYLVLTRKWTELGFTGKNLLRSLLVGVIVGVISGLIRYGAVLMAPDLFLGSRDAQEIHDYYDLFFGSGFYVAPFIILLFIPVTTFQEIFYRGYLQVRFASRLKPKIGSEAVRTTLAIGLSSLLYILWLFPGVGAMVIPLFLTSCAAGYLFHRYKNIMAPNAVITVEFAVVFYFIVHAGLV